MDVYRLKQGEKMTISLLGELGHHEAIGLMGRIGDMIETELAHTVALDISGVSFMDSSGIAVVLKGWKSTREYGGNFAVCGASKQAIKVLNAAGVGKIVKLEGK